MQIFAAGASGFGVFLDAGSAIHSVGILPRGVWPRSRAVALFLRGALVRADEIVDRVEAHHALAQRGAAPVAAQLVVGLVERAGRGQLRELLNSGDSWTVEA